MIISVVLLSLMNQNNNPDQIYPILKVTIVVIETDQVRVMVAPVKYVERGNIPKSSKYIR